MKNTSKPVYNWQRTFRLETCLDILDWFNDPDFEYINHIFVSKLDGEERIRRALPLISKHCVELIRAYANTPAAYPVADGRSAAS
ncbi:MAG: hypothetical protein ACSW8J_05475 [bacterium]